MEITGFEVPFEYDISFRADYAMLDRFAPWCDLDMTDHVLTCLNGDVFFQNIDKKPLRFGDIVAYEHGTEGRRRDGILC